MLKSRNNDQAPKPLFPATAPKDAGIVPRRTEDPGNDTTAAMSANAILSSLGERSLLEDDELGDSKFGLDGGQAVGAMGASGIHIAPVGADGEAGHETSDALSLDATGVYSSRARPDLFRWRMRAFGLDSKPKAWAELVELARKGQLTDLHLLSLGNTPLTMPAKAFGGLKVRPGGMVSTDWPQMSLMVCRACGEMNPLSEYPAEQHQRISTVCNTCVRKHLRELAVSVRKVEESWQSLQALAEQLGYKAMTRE